MKASQLFPVHDFEKELRWSEHPQRWQLYLAALVALYPDIANWERVVDLVRQKKGNDCIVQTAGGQEKRIQFKARRKDYGDMLFEVRHEPRDTSRPPWAGWINLPTQADRVIYVIETSRKAAVMDTAALWDSWRRCGPRWTQQYGEVPAPNRDYVTINVAVPWSQLKIEGVAVVWLEL